MAISCLNRMRHLKQPIDNNQCIRALHKSLSSNESTHFIDKHSIVELIKLLQVDLSIRQDDMLEIEWSYIPLLGGYRGATPKFLESKLAGNPEFFCEVIRLIYRSEKEEQDPSPLVDERVATSAWGLLSKWKILPRSEERRVGKECRSRMSTY